MYRIILSRTNSLTVVCDLHVVRGRSNESPLVVFLLFMISKWSQRDQLTVVRVTGDDEKSIRKKWENSHKLLSFVRLFLQLCFRVASLDWILMRSVWEHSYHRRASYDCPIMPVLSVLMFVGAFALLVVSSHIALSIELDSIGRSGERLTCWSLLRYLLHRRWSCTIWIWINSPLMMHLFMSVTCTSEQDIGLSRVQLKITFNAYLRRPLSHGEIL